MAVMVMKPLFCEYIIILFFVFIQCTFLQVQHTPLRRSVGAIVSCPTKVRDGVLRAPTWDAIKAQGGLACEHHINKSGGGKEISISRAKISTLREVTEGQSTSDSNMPTLELTSFARLHHDRTCSSYFRRDPRSKVIP